MKEIKKEQNNNNKESKRVEQDQNVATKAVGKRAFANYYCRCYCFFLFVVVVGGGGCATAVIKIEEVEYDSNATTQHVYAIRSVWYNYMRNNYSMVHGECFQSETKG